MRSIKQSQVTPKLRALFDPNEPQPQRCFAVLDGTTNGKIWTDDPAKPTWGIVMEMGDGTLYLGGWPSQALLAQIVAEERKNLPYVLVGLHYQDPRATLLPANPDYVGAALDITNRPVGKGLDTFLQRQPEACTIHQMDRLLFERCLWRAGLLAQYGTAENFLEKALAFCLMQGEEIVCEVYATPGALGKLEMGVETHEPYRRRGYALFTCAYAIQWCETLGYQTHWNCAKQNVASTLLARKLGYRTEQEYQVVGWYQENMSKKSEQ